MNKKPATISERDRKAAKAPLHELKESMENLLGNRMFKMILFGSRARGDYDDKSDIDVAIIVRGSTREIKNQILDKVAEIELKYLLPISTFIISQEEFYHLKKRERRIVLDIERDGVTL
jgi:predicted nucleotidyltransferase